MNGKRMKGSCSRLVSAICICTDPIWFLTPLGLIYLWNVFDVKTHYTLCPFLTSIILAVKLRLGHCRAQNSHHGEMEALPECLSLLTSVRELICPRDSGFLWSAVINVCLWRGILPAHMMSTTTMMMSSPALSWAAWPTSSIVTSSAEKTHGHIRRESTKCCCGLCDSLSQRGDVKLPSLWTSAGTDKGIKQGDRGAVGAARCKFSSPVGVIKAKWEQRSAETEQAGSQTDHSPSSSRWQDSGSCGITPIIGLKVWTQSGLRAFALLPTAGCALAHISPLDQTGVLFQPWVISLAYFAGIGIKMLSLTCISGGGESPEGWMRLASKLQYSTWNLTLL